MLPDMGRSQSRIRLQHDWLRAGTTHFVVQAAALASAGFQDGSFRPSFLVYAAGIAATPALLFAVALALLGKWRPRQRGSLVLTSVCAAGSALLCLDPATETFRDWTLQALFFAAPVSAFLVHGTADRNTLPQAGTKRPRTVADRVFRYMATLLAVTAVWLVAEMSLVTQWALMAAPIAILFAFILTSFLAVPFLLGLGLSHKLRPNPACPPWTPSLAAMAHFPIFLLWYYSDWRTLANCFWMLFALPCALGFSTLLWSRAAPARSPAC